MSVTYGSLTHNHAYGRTSITLTPPAAPWPLTWADCKCEVYDGPERCPQHGLTTRIGQRFNYVHSGG